MSGQACVKAGGRDELLLEKYGRYLRMNLIVAVDEKWGIGRDGGLLAHLPEDMKYFRETTRGKTVVMGRKTLESFPGGKPLKNRVNIVLSRNEQYAPEGVRVYQRVEDVLEALKGCGEDDVFVIGGGMIYREFLPYCTKAYVTYIRRTFDVDTDFENLDRNGDWELESVSDAKEHEGISFEFRIYGRVR